MVFPHASVTDVGRVPQVLGKAEPPGRRVAGLAWGLCQ